MERCVHKYVYNYCLTNNVFTSFQSGFTKVDSATYQLLDLYTLHFVKLREKKFVLCF